MNPSAKPFGSYLRRALAKGLLGRAREQSGVATVEAAFVLPIFCSFCVGFFDVGRGMWIQTNLQYAVTDAARCAALGSPNCPDVPAYADSRMFGVSVGASTFTYTPNAACGNTGYTKGSKVTAEYTLQTMFLGFVPALNNIKLKASACRP